MIKKSLFLLLPLYLFFSCERSTSTSNEPENDNFWWPKQPIPEAIAICKPGNTHGEKALAQSLAGIVAQAQKTGETDELIWIEAHGDYDLWYSKLIERTQAEQLGSFDVWQLLNRYKDLVQGYILYQPETNPTYRDDMDYSYHIAVSYAGTMRTIVIDPSLETKVQELGFEMLMDARQLQREQCLTELKENSDNDLLVTMNPCYHNNSDLAIANKAIMTYGTDYFVQNIMDWMDPVKPVAGWNNGDEFTFTQLPSKYGLFNTASDWCTNLISLSAGAEEANFTKVKTLDPKTINFDEGSHFHSFIISDGDNMQWSIGSFTKSTDFWSSPLCNQIPMGFTSCPINLSMMAPDVLDELASTQAAHTTLIEYGGGYQYPDLFAMGRGEDREAIQREFAQKVNANMKRTGAKVFGFICLDVDSENAKEAYRIYAEEIEGLTGMFAVQYSPYHGGQGEVIWVKNKQGIDIPVVAAKYCLWKDLEIENGGNVEDVVEAKNADIENKEESMDWTIVHAWSKFENPANPGETAGGMKPVKWCIDSLDNRITIVSPEELLWRIRMKHNKEETLQVISPT